MSKLLLLKKNKAKHYRVISNQSCFQDTSEDLLMELKNYRNLKLKQEISKKNRTPTIKTHRICNSVDLRPATTQFSTPKISLQEALKRKNNKILESYRLSSNPKPLNLTPCPSSPDFRQFLKTFQYFKSLKIEIELNSELTQAKLPKTDKSKALYSLLLDKMSGSTLKVQNSDQISDHIKEFCTVFREILRSLHNKGVDEELLNLEILWRLVLKLIDSSLVLQESTVSDTFENSENMLREMNEKCSKKVADMKFSMEEVTKSLRNQIAEQTNTISYLKRQNYYMESLVKQKEVEIADLMEPESQDKSCENMRGVFKKLVAYIREAETEQEIQVNALRSLSHVISIAEEFNKKPEVHGKEVQTDVSLHEIPLPWSELSVSSHPYRVFYEGLTVDKNVNTELIQVCENTLSDSEGLFPFTLEVVIGLSTEFDSKTKLKKSVQQLVNTLSSTNSPTTELFSSLLQLKNPFPPFISTALIQINKSLLQIKDGAYIPLPKLLDFIQPFFENDSDLIENTLESLSCTYNGTKETRSTVLLARLYLACSKNKGIEATQMLLQQQELKQSIKSSAGWTVSDQDLDFFFNNLDTGTDLSTQLSFIGSKVQGMKTEKNEVLLSIGKQMLRKVDKTLGAYSEVWNEEFIDNFVDLVQNNRKDLSESSIKLAFVQKIMQQDPSEILEKTLDYDFTDNKYRVASLLRKKPVTKRGKSKK